ncbi:class I SAM-dependent methyltransferase [Aureimonas pseudogalii]|uniref:SAM-dependent methyltransferase n=1 Tax=Aureimonas pseudogalii TaxID=1744844 RepID=A0A7W6H2N5_9HYPH|nr:class I SAM-dependent methyltransferase [Aureimonas pseudogalii]MBB3996845.1 SAM-dependent methyltransferase [Aureimonas pseudogalii]
MINPMRRCKKFVIWGCRLTLRSCTFSESHLSLNPYDDDFSKRLAAPDGHRNIIGGLWDEMGSLQRDYLVDQGLRPNDRLIDIGCGSLRAGVALVPYLDPGHYYGVDYLGALLEEGYEKEIRPLGLVNRLPRENLAEERAFLLPFDGVVFDVALAQSVFTHLPINHLRLCLTRLRPCMKAGGRFFCTFFMAEDEVDASAGIRQPPHGEVETFSFCDPFHVWERDIRFAMEGLAWRLDGIRDWNHPRGQQMAHFVAI